MILLSKTININSKNNLAIINLLIKLKSLLDFYSLLLNFTFSIFKMFKNNSKNKKYKNY